MKSTFIKVKSAKSYRKLTLEPEKRKLAVTQLHIYGANHASIQL